MESGGTWVVVPELANGPAVLVPQFPCLQTGVGAVPALPEALKGLAASRQSGCRLQLFLSLFLQRTQGAVPDQLLHDETQAALGCFRWLQQTSPHPFFGL